ncbi:Dienelactone hydrolase family [invertebrate metagenome]|uniref:Dienelactone hydrolase family n=1 Tax=invertebrate metagenome TaxID=1711999 RepID=A0A484H8N1_9ZZZZ
MHVRLEALQNMGEMIRLAARDGHLFEAYVAWPTETPRGGLVVLQEVFGVNSHIRAVTDRFAAEQGYIVIAPALFDRLESKVSLDYDDASLVRGRALRLALGWKKPLLDIEATRAFASSSAKGTRKVGVVGFCWGGSLAWLAACRLSLQVAVCYYGGQIAQFLEERPICPVMMHFGRDDPIIPAADQKAIMDAHPEGYYHSYEAGHGFNCNERLDFQPECAAAAWSHTSAFLANSLS